jgi:CRISPR-associated protein Cas5d
MDYRYLVSFEVAGPTALFARPDGGSTPVSYPVPTWGALKGMLECVAPHAKAYLHPTHVEICSPIRTARYATNYGGPLRKAGQIKEDNNLQLIATVLCDVRYRVHAAALPLEQGGNGANHAHALQEIFQRRLAAGKLFHTPCLGWKEFTPTYFGPLLSDSRANPDINLYVPSLLFSVFDRNVRGKWGPRFQRRVRVEKGVLRYDADEATAESGGEGTKEGEDAR